MAILVLPAVAYAQAGPPAAAGMTMLQAIQASVNQWAGPLRTAAQELLGALGVISLVFAVGYAYLNGDGVTGMFAVALRMIIWLGFVTFVIEGFPAFGNAVISSFQQLAQQAGSVPSSPTDVMNVGTNIGTNILKMGSFWHPATVPGLIVCAGFAACSFYVVAALMLLSLAKAYITVGIGTLFLGFAGHEFTMPQAMGVRNAVISAGARLFTIQLLAGIGATLIRGWMGETTILDDAGLLTTIGVSVIYAILVFSVPAGIEGMANGHGGHARVGPGEMMRIMAQSNAVLGGAARGINNLASAGASMMGGLPGSGGGGSGSLPPPSAGAGASSSSSASAAAGQRMRPQNASFSPRTSSP